MTIWIKRSIEERSLLNPGFCSILLWKAAQGYSSTRPRPMSIELSFIVLPLVLHKDTRENLPVNIRASLSTWLAENPIVLTRLVERASVLRASTRESLIFGGIHHLLALGHEGVRANTNMKRRVNAVLKSTSDEVRDCAKRAEFLGRWLEKAGGPETVMALLGVRP